MERPVKRISFVGMITTIVVFCNVLEAAAQQKRLLRVTINCDGREMPLKKALMEIEQQTGVHFFYKDRLVEAKAPVTTSIYNMNWQQLLDLLLNERKLNWTYNESTNIVEVVAVPPQPAIATAGNTQSRPMVNDGIMVTGRIICVAGTVLAGATVFIENTGKVVAADESGNFSLSEVAPRTTLVFTCIGYKRKEVVVTGRELLVILEPAQNLLDEAIVQGYGATSKRWKTGSIGKITGADLTMQPVLNPLAALEGRVAGMQAKQLDGSPGGGSKILIRGIGSIGAAGLPISSRITNDPLFIIDGTPFAPNNTAASGGQFIALNAGLSPFININPEDLESIEVLKDADATAIYGSRGGNGVVLMTSKKGVVGQTVMQANITAGVSTHTHLMPLLTTADYLRIRREAFNNDQLPVKGNEFIFDTTRYTDFNRQLLGQPSYQQCVQLSITRGDSSTRFYSSIGYSRETAAYASARGQRGFGMDRFSLYGNLDHAFNRQFGVNVTMMTSWVNDRLTANMPLLNPALQAPDQPDFYKNGQLVWNYNGVNIGNTAAGLLSEYNAKPNNLVLNTKWSYRFRKGFSLIVSAGHNGYHVKETRWTPQKAIAPYDTANKNNAVLSDVAMRSFIVEPQLDYKIRLAKGVLHAMIGGTWQQNVTSYISLSDRGFLPDNIPGFLEAGNGGTYRTYTNKFSRYRYQAFFGRVNYMISDHNNTWVLNLSGRRDGSSRFADEKRFSFFGAAGLAWIFKLPFLSFGKWRSSYGILGNDGIGDFSYLATFSAGTTYESQPTFVPASLYNGSYTWEKTTKLETALELGLAEDRLLVTLACYTNRTSNQLLNDKLSSQTGFTTVLRNYPAVVENRGLEIELSSVNWSNRKGSWKTSFVMSYNQNKLVSFKGLEQSLYADYLVIGKPITLLKGFVVKGVNEQTGLYEFATHNNASLPDKEDKAVFGDLSPVFFGGLSNTATYGQWQLTVALSFVKQTGLNYLSLFAVPASGAYNPPTLVLGQYWRQPGDHATMQKLTQNTSSVAYDRVKNYFSSSNGVYSDASYVRVKNIQLLYQLKGAWLKRYGVQSFQVFIRAQNWFTFTRYQGVDPENPGFAGMPPMKTISAGMHISFK